MIKTSHTKVHWSLFAKTPKTRSLFAKTPKTRSLFAKTPKTRSLFAKTPKTLRSLYPGSLYTRDAKTSKTNTSKNPVHIHASIVRIHSEIRVFWQGVWHRKYPSPQKDRGASALKSKASIGCSRPWPRRSICAASVKAIPC